MRLYARFLKNQVRDAESKTIEANAVAVARILLPSQAPVRAGVLKVGAGVTPAGRGESRSAIQRGGAIREVRGNRSSSD